MKTAKNKLIEVYKRYELDEDLPEQTKKYFKLISMQVGKFPLIEAKEILRTELRRSSQTDIAIEYLKECIASLNEDKD